MGKTLRFTKYGVVTKEGRNPRFNEQGTTGTVVYTTRKVAIAAATACSQRRALELKQQMSELSVPADPEDDIYMMS